MVEPRYIFEGEELQGPGWFMFFTETVVTIPPSNGGGSTSKKVGPNTFLHQREELSLEEDDLFDIVALLVLSNLIE